MRQSGTLELLERNAVVGDKKSLLRVVVGCIDVLHPCDDFPAYISGTWCIFCRPRT